MFYNIVNISDFLFFKFFCGLKIIGKKNIPRKGGFILVSNHVSYLDPMVLAAASPRSLNFMARHDLFTNPLFGWLLKDLNAFEVKRKSADLSALKEAILRLNKGLPLAMFPEGTRQTNGVLGEPEAGVGFLASRCAVPVVPAFIQGTDKVMPRGKKCIQPHKIIVLFGEKIFVERRTPYEATAKMIMDSIRRLSCLATN